MDNHSACDCFLFYNPFQFDRSGYQEKGKIELREKIGGRGAMKERVVYLMVIIARTTSFGGIVLIYYDAVNKRQHEEQVQRR